ncbi:hypothetical protein CSUI_002248 [Cystoisospora suis]|uniref:Phd-finger domain-containing protein n=1 Tax=Cystoisospora suis TaxID=483139 RepID=A0A2C6L9T9_9APIC|nr:hypothetical protein CSUI_002248 [Cystoisospora suis]
MALLGAEQSAQRVLATAAQPSREGSSAAEPQQMRGLGDEGQLCSSEVGAEGLLEAIGWRTQESEERAAEANIPSNISTLGEGPCLHAEESSSSGSSAASGDVRTPRARLPKGDLNRLEIPESFTNDIRCPTSEEGGSRTSSGLPVSDDFQSSLEERSQLCAKCGTVGEFICCVACLRSFHASCVMEELRLPDVNLETAWTCPHCKDPGQIRLGKPSAGDTPKPAKPEVQTVRSVDRNDCENGVPPPSEARSIYGRSRDQCKEVYEREGNSSEAGGPREAGEKQEYMAATQHAAEGTVSPKAYGCSTVRSASPSPSNYGRKRRRGDSGPSTATRCKVNIGPRHQVPAVPPFFLDSSCVWDGHPDTLVGCESVYANDDDETARLVYSPYAMQRVHRKRLAEGAEGRTITTAEDMNNFIQRVAENWSSKSGWQPFSPEYAFKLLHFAGYDPHRAIRIMKDPSFSFIAICDPPQRRYDNKWRPKDRRGQIGTNPFPSPLTLRAYLAKRSQYAAASTFRLNSTRPSPRHIMRVRIFLTDARAP